MGKQFKNNSREMFSLPKKEIMVSNSQDAENEHDILDIEIGMLNNTLLWHSFCI